MSQAIVIIENGADDGENHRVIGPFADGETASSWAFRTLEVGTLWYWLPLEPVPAKRGLTEAQARALAATDKGYAARRIRGQWVVWCNDSDHVVEF